MATEAERPEAERERVNRTRYRPGQRAGHYESFYQRANHPTEPLAYWIRYTIFSPAGEPERAVGELWAVLFDGATGRHVVAKEEHPIGDCAFSTESFDVRVGAATLGPGALSGRCGDTIGWDLTYDGTEPPLYLLPKRAYDRGFPKAKSLVGTPLATYRGTVTAEGRTVDVDGWVGSQNHNWGSRHTDHYAFGQVAGFDNAPGSFLEIVTAQARVGPLRTPFLTFAVLRHEGREHALVTPRRALAARARFGYFSWEFTCRSDTVRLAGRITAPREAFVGLRYGNPPGGSKHCLNTKIGSCELDVTELDVTGGGRTHRLSAEHRALFEILTDDRRHGVPLRA